MDPCTPACPIGVTTLPPRSIAKSLMIGPSDDLCRRVTILLQTSLGGCGPPTPVAWDFFGFQTTPPAQPLTAMTLYHVPWAKAEIVKLYAREATLLFFVVSSSVLNAAVDGSGTTSVHPNTTTCQSAGTPPSPPSRPVDAASAGSSVAQGVGLQRLLAPILDVVDLCYDNDVPARIVLIAASDADHLGKDHSGKEQERGEGREASAVEDWEATARSLDVLVERLTASINPPGGKCDEGEIALATEDGNVSFKTLLLSALSEDSVRRGLVPFVAEAMDDKGFCTGRVTAHPGLRLPM